MKTAYLPLSRTCRWSVVSVSLLFTVTAQAQQTGSGSRLPLAISADEFYRKGDKFSEKVSGFFGNLFGDRRRQAQSALPSQPSYQASQPYQQAPATQLPKNSYSEAPKTTSSRSASTVQAPKTKSYATSSRKSDTPSSEKTATAKPKTSSTASTPSGGYYTSTKRSNEFEERSSPKTSTQESVVQAPKPQVPVPASSTPSPASTGISPYAINDTTPASTLPKTTPPEPTTKTTPPTASTQQEFPTGSVGKKPGRVVSPYPPHNELDVRGLSSGSLALDPTTQKVFKVP